MDWKLDAAAAVGRPQRGNLSEDAVSQLVPGTSERESRMGVEALEAPVARRSADSERQLGAESSLFRCRGFQARGELGVGAHALAPALDASRGLEARDGCNEVRARQPERRRERCAVLVVRRLLGHGGTAERTARDYAAERARPAAEL